MGKRVKIILIISAILIICLLARLMYIQILSKENLAEAAKIQQEIQVTGIDCRGTIYDRNMKPLTNRKNIYCFVIPNEKINEKFQRLLKENNVKKIGTKGAQYQIFSYSNYKKSLIKKIKKDFDGYVFKFAARYEENQIAAHIIGYLSNGGLIGSSGVEKICQGQLSFSQENYSVLGDGLGKIIKGSPVMHKNKSADVRTTIEIGIQHKIESIIKKRSMIGAVIVLDRNSGQILAMASSPTFNPNSIETYLNSNKGELINKAIQGLYPPGSVFKIVVAAAALESNFELKNYSFTCNKQTEVNGIKLSCSAGPELGHGDLTMKEAFAKSCNCYFANLGEKIGSEQIVQMAGKLGLGSKSIKNCFEEKVGVFPSVKERRYSGISNLSIGQGNLAVTPLGVARMTNIIANKGKDMGVSIIKNDKDKHQKRRQVISSRTAVEIKNMMREVMISGTGFKESEGINNSKIKTAGKTGTAEYLKNGRYLTHGWFTGFFPANNPQYTVTVFCENGKTGSSSALPVFNEILDFYY